MRIEYVSDVLNKRFTSEEELVKAEKEFAEKQKEIETRKKDREIRAKEVQEAIDKATSLLDDFIKDYGSFHTSFHDKPTSIMSLFNDLFKL